MIDSNKHLGNELQLIMAQFNAMGSRFDSKVLATAMIARGAGLMQALVTAGFLPANEVIALFDSLRDEAVTPLDTAPKVAYLDGGKPVTKQ